MFKKRARRRAAFAYFLLVISLLVISSGFYIFFDSLHGFARQVQSNVIYSHDGANQQTNVDTGKDAQNEGRSVDMVDTHIDLSGSTLSRHKEHSFDSEKITFREAIQLVVVVVMLIFIFFIAQILLKLYRYNILISDFYSACDDALILTERSKKCFSVTEFSLLVKTLQPEKITLESESIPDVKSLVDLIKKK